MAKKETAPESPAAGEAVIDTEEPSNVQLETIGNRVKIRTAICSGVVSFGVTQAEAEQYVVLGTARIIGMI